MSDIHPILVPKWGLSMTEGTLTQWTVGVDSEVQPGDVVAEIETEKIVNELETQFGGVLRRQLVSEGEAVPVGGLLGVIAARTVSEDEIDAFIRSESGDSAKSGGAPVVEEVPPPATTDGRSEPESPAAVRQIPESLTLADGTENAATVNATFLAVKLANQLCINLEKISGSGRRGRISKRDIDAAIAAVGGSAATLPVGGAVHATPLAKRLAARHDIALADISGTGMQGRVTRNDVLASVNNAANPPPSSDSGAATMTGGQAAGIEVPFSNMRRVIARRLSAAKQSAPHFRIAVDIRMDDLLALRSQINYEGCAQRVSVNDMLIKAAAITLEQIPQMNVQFDGETLRQLDSVDISVAIAIDDGLITPIVRFANRKEVMEIAGETMDLIARTKSGELRSHEIDGGTFTISNLGMFGVTAFDAIINQPQVSILAVGATVKQKVFVGDREDTALMLRATLSCDHRIVDGVLGAKFMQALRQIIENPGRILL